MPGTKYCANSGPAIMATPVLSLETNLLSDNIQRSSQADILSEGKSRHSDGGWLLEAETESTKSLLPPVLESDEVSTRRRRGKKKWTERGRSAVRTRGVRAFRGALTAHHAARTQRPLKARLFYLRVSLFVLLLTVLLWPVFTSSLLKFFLSPFFCNPSFMFSRVFHK